MPLLLKKSVMAAKVEATPGTAESLTNAEGAFNIYNPVMQATIPVEQRQGQGGFNKLIGVPGARTGTLTFSTDLAWDGTVTLPSWATVLMPACGWVNSSGELTPRTEAPGTNVKTLTLATYIDGVRKLMYGAVGTFQIVLPAGRMGMINWTFTGIWDDITDVAILGPTYPTATPLRVSSSALTYNSTALIAEQLTIDAGNVVVLREDTATATGYKSGIITDRTPIITANPESTLVATDDPYGDWVAGTANELAIVLDGPTDATLTIAATKAQITNVQQGDRNGVMIDDITWTCTKNAANDQELVFTFAEAS